MDEEAMPRRIMWTTDNGKRGDQKHVEKDAIMLGIRSWWSTAMNRGEWRRLLREARTLTEL
jgi:hypothetical protein